MGELVWLLQFASSSHGITELTRKYLLYNLAANEWENFPLQRGNNKCRTAGNNRGWVMGRKILSLVCIVAVHGCGGGDGGDSPQAALSCDNPTINQNSSTTIAVAGSTAEFEQSVQKALAQIAANQCIQAKQFGGTTTSGKGDVVSAPSAPPTAVPAPAGNAQAGGQVGGGSGGSRTNVQEQGVDEADLVKYNGKYLFVGKRATLFSSRCSVAVCGGVAPPVFSDAPQAAAVASLAANANRIRILAPNDDGSQVNELGAINIAGDNLDLAALYTGEVDSATANQVVALSRSYSWNTQPLVDQTPTVVLALAAPRTISASTRVDLFDVGNPQSPAASWQLQIEGDYLGSRRIGDTLYLVTEFTPTLSTLNTWAASQAELEQKLQAIKQVSAAELLPYAQINGEATKVVDPASCVVANNPGIYTQQLALTAIVAIDLARKQISSTACAIDTTSNWNQSIYASTGNIYVNGMQYLPEGTRTTIYQFALANNAVTFASYGSVPGTLAGSNAPYSMSEEAGHLRVLTEPSSIQFIGIGFSPTSASRPADALDMPTTQRSLFVLKPENGALTFVSQLPNDQHPEPIGKPGEHVHGVRFFGSRAYVVTFKKTDPLYVLNLDDPLNPVIAGALEIPGYSDYLHPLGDKYLLGVGKDADDQGTFAWFKGVKVALFDVADLQNPKVVKNFLIGERGSETPVNSDPHAFTIVGDAQSGVYRLALPVVYHADSTGAITEASQYRPWQYNGLFTFDLNVAGSTPEFNNVGVMKAQQATSEQPFSTVDFTAMRSVIIGDNVHFISDAQVWSAPWVTPTQSVGPQ